jgi:predicted  nucleic acid-binding Zn-ribbon protein
LSVSGGETQEDLDIYLPAEKTNTKSRRKEIQSNVTKYKQELEAVRKLYRSKRISKTQFEKTKNRITRDINKIKRK